MNKITCRFLSSVLLACSPLAAAAQAPAAKPAAPAKPAPVAPPVLELRSYAITALDPNDINQAYATLFARMAAGKDVAAPKITLLAKNKTLLVRGTKAQLDVSDAILHLLQNEPTAAKGQQVIALKAARVDEVLAALQALELADQVVPLRTSNAVVLVPSSEANGQQVKKVIEAAEKVSEPAKTPVKNATR